MKFTQITMIDDCGIKEPIVQKISELSKSPLAIFNNTPGSKEEIIQRIGDSDCILLSWKTSISKEILQACPSLKFIGLCCSLYDEKSANVDIAAARELGITVKGVRDYGDEGAAEFIFAQLVYLFQGLGQYQWKADAAELKGKSIGIIGLGTLGGMVATMAGHFGMKVFYYNRNRKAEAEQQGITYLPLQELLATCDVVTTHLPKKYHPSRGNRV
jgi:phosphoglycerate dehydrogenase-like enzyme